MAIIKLANFGSPGFVKDVAEYDSVPEAWNEVRNVRFNPIGAQTIPGHKAVLSPADFEPLWLRVFPPIDRPIWVYGGLNKLIAFDGTHNDITRLSGLYNGQADQRWQGEVFQGIGIFNNVLDVPQAWLTFDAGVKLIDLANWPSTLRCRALRSFKNFLIAMYMIEDGNDRPYRVRWSHPADPGTIPSSWAINDPTKDSGEFDIADTDDYIVDGLRLGDFFLVYKQKTVYSMQFIGGNFIFSEDAVLASRGLLWRDCVQSFSGGHFVAGIDDLYIHSGQRGSDQSIVEAKLRNWIFNQIDATNFFNCYTVAYRRQNEYWFCFPEAGETYPTIAVIWNSITGGIGIRDIPRSPFIYPGPVDVSGGSPKIWGGARVTGSGSLLGKTPTIIGTGTTTAGAPGPGWRLTPPDNEGDYTLDNLRAVTQVGGSHTATGGDTGLLFWKFDEVTDWHMFTSVAHSVFSLLSTSNGVSIGTNAGLWFTNDFSGLALLTGTGAHTYLASVKGSDKSYQVGLKNNGSGPVIAYSSDNFASDLNLVFPAGNDLYSIAEDGASGPARIAVGYNGTILTSTSPGTWTQRTSGTTSLLVKVAALSGHAIAVGANDGMVRSNGSITSWTTVSYSYPKSIQWKDVVIDPDFSRAHAVGIDEDGVSVLGYSTDINFSTWVVQAVAGTGLNAIALTVRAHPDSTYAWAVGYGGTIIEIHISGSSDSWIEVTSPTSQDLHRISSTNDIDGRDYAVGDNDTIIMHWADWEFA